ncbi:MAG: IPT/TIG domain-containing protein [Gemmatimonadales bacterium]
MPRTRRFARLLLALLVLGGCNSPTTVVTLPVEVVVGSGDGQFGVIGTQLPAPLRVVVRSLVTGQPRRGVTVLWEITSGGATLVGASTAATDSTGSAEARVRLGPNPGEVGVRARVADQQGAAEFKLFGVDRPTITSVTPPSAAAGDTVTVTGTNFSPVALQDIVLFSGMRGRVVSATGTSLRVLVPRCLPARDVGVNVQLGGVASEDTLDFAVTGGSTTTPLQVGAVLDVADDQGFECHLLPGGSGVSYLALVYSASTVGAARHPFQLTALGSFAAPSPERAPPPALQLDGRAPPFGSFDRQAAWDQHLRELERTLIRERTPGLRGPAATAAPPAPVPVLGEQRSFNVLNGHGGFDRVGAVARSVGSHAAIFVDTLAPTGGFSTGELDAFAARFDQVIYPRDTTTFGRPSDLDANGRIVILFTPAVNRLTPPGSSSFVGGFFYGVDLLPSSSGSNGGEIFYSIVPDPAGAHGNVRSKSAVANVVPAILAHEFQHMIHFNERILVRGAETQEALWLSEALAQMAEELVYRDYVALGDTASQTLFRKGVRDRSRIYLQRPDTVSVIVTTGQGSLPERGAGFLNLLYVEDHLGVDVLSRLTKTTLTGVANVETATGEAWADLVADWWTATYTDLPTPAPGPLQYPDIDLKGFLAPFPLSPTLIGAGGANFSGSLWSSSVGYYLVTPGPGAPLALRLGGEAGGAVSAQAVLRLRLVRIS